MTECVLCIDEEKRRLHRRSFSRAMYWDADLPGDLVEQLWRDPHLLLAGGQPIQDKPRCATVRIDHSQGTYFFKHHNWGGPFRTLKKSLGHPRLRPSWFDGRYLHAMGVPTPRPRAYVERRLGPLNIDCYLLTEYIPGDTLYRFMRFQQPSEEVVERLARQVAAIWQQLDDLKICHNDLKTENFLIDQARRLWLIDLEKACRNCRPEEIRRHQAEDIVRLLHPRNWRANPAAAEIFRQHLLQTAAGRKCAGECVGDDHPLMRPAPDFNVPSQLLTVLIPCLNNELVIADCLNSIGDIADEIVVADAGSTDRTLEIVRQYDNCRIIQSTENICRSGPSVDPANPKVGIAPSPEKQTIFENWAAQHARHNWILKIRPDERVSPDLAIEIQHLLAKEPSEEGFKITRRYYFWGKLLRYGTFRNDSSLRLYRKGAGWHAPRDGRGEVVITWGRAGQMRAKLLYQACWNVGHFLRESTETGAAAVEETSPATRGPRRKRVSFHAVWQFFYSYILRFGWLDGRAGLHASCLLAISTYLREMRQWDQRVPPSQFPAPEYRRIGEKQAERSAA